MTTSPGRAMPDSAPQRVFLSPFLWLLLGVCIAPLVGMRANVPLLAWVNAAPWLLYLRSTKGWRSRVLFGLTLQLATFLSMWTIVTEPLPWFMALGFSIPSALGAWLAFLLFEWLRRRLSDDWGLLLFPALTVASEWLNAHGSPLGSWGASAYTQLDHLVLLQSVSLFGLGTLGLLIGASNSLVAVGLARLARGRSQASPRSGRCAETTSLRRVAALWAGLMLALQLYGVWRLDGGIPGETVPVAGIVSDIGMSAEGLPEPQVLRAGTEALWTRSTTAIERGARLVVWSEGATAVERADEADFLARAEALAQTHRVDLVVSYVVPLEGMTRFENTYVWFGPEGRVEQYFKHHPVPGEGAEPGTAPLQVLQRPYGRIAGAICYDYDFPAMAQAHGADDAGLVFVPASDWRGIDPYHTQMAAVRGIEQGFSVLRPVRWATSGAYDAHGRVRASLPWFEANDRILWAWLPTERVVTLYSRVGDVLPLAALGLVLVGVMLAFRRGQQRGDRAPDTQ